MGISWRNSIKISYLYFFFSLVLWFHLKTISVVHNQSESNLSPSLVMLDTQFSLIERWTEVMYGKEVMRSWNGKVKWKYFGSGRMYVKYVENSFIISHFFLTSCESNRVYFSHDTQIPSIALVCSSFSPKECIIRIIGTIFVGIDSNEYTHWDGIGWLPSPNSLLFSFKINFFSLAFHLPA